MSVSSYPPTARFAGGLVSWLTMSIAPTALPCCWSAWIGTERTGERWKQMKRCAELDQVRGCFFRRWLWRRKRRRQRHIRKDNWTEMLGKRKQKKTSYIKQNDKEKKTMGTHENQRTLSRNKFSLVERPVIPKGRFSKASLWGGAWNMSGAGARW